MILAIDICLFIGHLFVLACVGMVRLAVMATKGIIYLVCAIHDKYVESKGGGAY